MVIDTSAVVAILFDEPDRRRLNELIESDSTRLISAATLVESSMVVEGQRGEAAGRELDMLVHCARSVVVAVDTDQAELARVAFRRYGKGRQPAGLNFGDCFAYALAKASGELNQCASTTLAAVKHVGAAPSRQVFRIA